LLKHAYANRLWAPGIPLEEIAQRLEHQSVSTYLHAAPFLQRELMLEYSRAPISITTREVAILSGIGERQTRHLINAQKLTGLDLNNVLKLLIQMCL
jgi:hypothetical protein